MNHLVLISPEADLEDFERDGEAICGSIHGTVTIYAHPGDMALFWAQIFNSGAPRGLGVMWCVWDRVVTRSATICSNLHLRIQLPTMAMRPVGRRAAAGPLVLLGPPRC